MGAAIQLVDEMGIGNVVRTSLLELASRRLTVRELIEARVRAEVRAFNHEPADVYHGLVQPTETERAANGYRFKKKGAVIDAEAQCTEAVRAFENQRFLLLVGDVQAESLDEWVEVLPGTRVSFVRLVPLVGG